MSGDVKNEEMVEDLPIPTVLSFLDVGFLKFDQTIQRPHHVAKS